MNDRQTALDEWRELYERGAAASGPLSRPALTAYYQNWALKKIFGAFEFSGMPDTWDQDYFLTRLFIDGHIAVTDTEIGVIPLRCGITGVNVFDHPTTALFANPVLGNFERDLFGDDPKTSCALIKLQYDYNGVMPLVYKYAALLSECDISINVNLRNSKVAFIGFVDSKQQSATMEKLFTEIESGKPAVYVKKGDALTQEDIYYNHVKETYIANDIQLLKQSIINDFLTEVGLNNANTDKRERLIVDEVNANDEEIRANVQHWLDTMSEGIKRANSLFGLNLNVTLRKFSGKGGADAGKTQDTE